MEPIHVLVSTKVTARQLERMRASHPRLEVHGEPGGYAIVDPRELDHKGIDYPDERPDVDVESLLRASEVVIATRIPSDITERAPNLRWIQVTSAGIDHLWQPCLDGADITVTSAKGLHGIPMAEFVLAGMLAFAKGLPRLAEQKREGRWERFVVSELHGATVVLVGLGAIGGAVARACKAMGMQVVGVRRRPGREGVPAEVDSVVTVERLNEALARGDYVVNSLPLTARTERLLDAEAFGAMKPDCVFINVGRGRTVDQEVLVRALEDGRIAGAVLDTFEQEPLPADSPLWRLPNVVLSPHMGADTPLYMERMTDILCDNLKRYAAGEPPRNVVDPVERY